MTDRPILFSAPMVRALIDGRKTQTRRLAKITAIMGNRVPVYPPEELIELEEGEFRRGIMHYLSTGALSGPYPIGFAVGDRLYVREEYYQFGHWEAVEGALTKGGREKWKFVGTQSLVQFEAPAEFLSARCKPFPGLPRWYKRLGRFMPRQYSRLTLNVTDVRVQRLKDCSEVDAIAEGIEPAIRTSSGQFYRNYRSEGCPLMAYGSYASLWDSINGPGAWDENPWVVAVSLTVEQRNIDQVPA